MTGRVRLVRVDSAGLLPYAERLRALELEVRYPLDEGRDHFRIDHGPSYHPFFSGLGDAHFLVALDGDDVVGCFCGIFREARQGGRGGARLRTVYLCDFKLARPYRGAGLGVRMAWRALSTMAEAPRFRSWQLGYFTTMRGERGDVGRSLKGLHAGRLLQREAVLAIYFASPASLAALDVATSPAPPLSETGLDLSPQAGQLMNGEGFCSTAGRKDLLRDSGGAFRLAHYPTSPGEAGWAAGLKRLGESLARKGSEHLGCFAVDERLAGHVDWLQRQGVVPGARGSVYTLRWPGGPRRPSWMHQATQEI